MSVGRRPNPPLASFQSHQGKVEASMQLPGIVIPYSQKKKLFAIYELMFHYNILCIRNNQLASTTSAYSNDLRSPHFSREIYHPAVQSISVEQVFKAFWYVCYRSIWAYEFCSFYSAKVWITEVGLAYLRRR